MEEFYYAGLLRECQRYSLEDVDEEHVGGKLRLTLADIYQDQFVRLPASDLEQRETQDRQAQVMRDKTVPLMEALEKLQSSQIVIRGKVGSGKSSFVNYLAASIILSHDGSQRQSLADKLAGRPVVRILLRQWGTDIHAEIDHRGLLLEAIHAQIEFHIRDEAKTRHENIAPDEMDSFVRVFTGQAIKNGVILLDGLDEVGLTNNKRDIVLKAIANFVDNANISAQTHIILTSRPHAYEHHLSGFVRMELEPMGGDQVDRFIRHWYQQVSRDRQIDKKDPGNQKRAADLIKQIHDRESLQVLTETPLLLTLVLGIDFANYRLPESRADLYDRAIKLLLQRWHRNLQGFREALDPKERTTLEILEEHAESTGNLRKALCHLALDSYYDAQGKNDESGDTILFRETQVLGHLTKLYGQSVDAEAVRYFLQYCSNLLVAAGDETLQFRPQIVPRVPGC